MGTYWSQHPVDLAVGLGEARHWDVLVGGEAGYRPANAVPILARIAGGGFGYAGRAARNDRI